jgi:hypothetical protein
MPPRCVALATPPLGPNDEKNAIAPTISTKYFAGIGNTKYM